MIGRFRAWCNLRQTLRDQLDVFMQPPLKSGIALADGSVALAITFYVS